MLVNMTDVAVDDAEQLEHRWGVEVAVEMLHEGLLSPTQFLWLCAEAANAEDLRAEEAAHRCRSRDACHGHKPGGRRGDVALSTM